MLPIYAHLFIPPLLPTSLSPPALLSHDQARTWIIPRNLALSIYELGHLFIHLYLLSLSTHVFFASYSPASYIWTLARVLYMRGEIPASRGGDYTHE
jgi:hypothetical protein